jgi:hypothetical protein
MLVIFCQEYFLIERPSPWRLCYNPFLSLRATEGSVAISLFSMPYEIASVVSLPRSDILTQSLVGEGFSASQRVILNANSFALGSTVC